MNWDHIIYLAERIFGYAVGLSSTLIMLYALLKIYSKDYIKFIEPNQFILVTEIIMTSIALILIVKFTISDTIMTNKKLR